MQKYAAFEVLSADLVPGITPGTLKRATAAVLAEAERILGQNGGSVTLKTAHRHAFVYEARPGFLYVRSRAISSRCNDNFDEFPADEIKKAYSSFIGKPVFVNHRNDNHRRARGVIIDAALHEDTNPDGSPDTWCEVLMEVDAVRFPKLAEAILKGHIDRTSMGTDVAYSVCSYCGNKAATPLEYCAHIPKLKGQRIYRTTASGQREGVLVREICYGLGFFENSLLVEEPADPTAFFLGVEGLGVTASRIDVEAVTAEAMRILAEAGTKIAWDENEHPRGQPDNAGEFAKGHGATPPKAHPVADTGTPKPAGAAIGTPPGDNEEGGKNHPVHTESVEEAAHLLVEGKYVRLRQPRQVSTLLDRLAEMVKNAKVKGEKAPVINLCQVTVEGTNLFCVESKGIPRIKMPQLMAKHPIPGSKADKLERGPNGEVDLAPHFREYLHGKGIKLTQDTVPANVLKASQNELNGSKVAGMVQAIEAGTMPSARIFVSNDDYVVDGHHRWAATVGADTENNVVGDMTMDVEVIDLPIIDLLREANEFSTEWGIPQAGLTAALRRLAARADWGPKEQGYYREGYEIGRQTCASGGHLSEEVKTRMGKHGDFAAGVREGLDSCKTATLKYVAYGETLAPTEVDTLRDEMCPVCGEEDAYDGEACLVCGFVKPPDVFMDPDLDAAKANDLRQDQDDERLPGAGDLVCPSCGDTFQSPAEGGQPVALEAFVPPDDEGDVAEAADAPGAAPAAPAKPDPAKATDPSQTFDNSMPKNKPAPDTDPKAKADPDKPETAPKEGDDCPTCGKGQLKHKDAPTPPPAQSDKTPPKDEDKDGDDDAKDDDDDDDDKKSKSKPPWLKDKKQSQLAATAALHGEGEDVTMRPALAALAEQQRQINALRQGFSTIASLAGLDGHPVVVATLRDSDPSKVAAILKQADENNPAQPIPDPAPEAPAATTQETRAPDATDDPNNLGASPLTDVAPAATASPTDVGGTVLDEPLDLNEKDVTAPVAGTDTLGEGQRGAPGTNRTETDVQVGNPNNPAVPWPETGWTNTSAKTDGRTWASLRLAKLRIQADIEQGDELAIGQAIDSGAMTDEGIQTEIETLSKVLQRQASGRQTAPAGAPRHLVPRAAARTAPSLATAAAEQPFVQPMQDVAAGPSDEEFAFE